MVQEINQSNVTEEQLYPCPKSTRKLTVSKLRAVAVVLDYAPSETLSVLWIIVEITSINFKNAHMAYNLPYFLMIKPRKIDIMIQHHQQHQHQESLVRILSHPSRTP